MLIIVHPGVIWGNWTYWGLGLIPRHFGVGWSLGTGSFKKLPGDSEMQPRIRSNDLRQEEGRIIQWRCWKYRRFVDVVPWVLQGHSGRLSWVGEGGMWEVRLGLHSDPMGIRTQITQWPWTWASCDEWCPQGKRTLWGGFAGRTSHCVPRSCVYCCDGLAMNTDG